MLRAAPAFLICAASFGQGLQFEVATVKPTAPEPDGRMRIMMRGGPGSDDPGRAQYAGITLKNLLAIAYSVRQFQVSGPSWLDSERFDVVAKVPEGATKEQFNLMLQNLIAERFKLTLHREKKDFPLYELTVAKGGSKLKPAVEVPKAQDPVQQGPPPPGKNGMPQLPAGRPNMAMMMGRGVARISARVQTLDGVVGMLSQSLNGIVVDKTGLTGKFDFDLEFAPEGVSLGPLPPGPPGGDAGTPSDYPNLFTAVQEQLGLKLDKKTGPADLLVIDRAEKTPTEN